MTQDIATEREKLLRTMKYLPRNISDFSTMITDNYLYVDKTKHIYDLYAQGDRFHFLSRPQRFGKSLLISTLKELFSNNKSLFKDLWIYNFRLSMGALSSH
jgi:hypothetical protein